MFGKTLLVAAAFVAVAYGAACPDTELTKLTPIATNSNVGQCTTDSGFNLIPPSGLPNDEQKTKMCKSDACKNLIVALKALNPSDCDLTILGVTLNVGQLVGSFDSDCQRLTATPTTAPPATTTAPSTTTSAPSTTTSAPSTTTSTPSTTTATPSTTTTAPSAAC